jgi:colicin import membrane protein
MPRKLKTYQTSLGFFDLAVAAPSMKAALEAWGTHANLFHQGFAKEADDPAIVAATMAKPGVVLKRAVGSNASFSEHAELPKDLPVDNVKAAHRKPITKFPAPPPAHKGDDKAARAAAVAHARDQKRRDRERRRQETERERRRQAIEKALTALEEAKRFHDNRTKEITAARFALDRQSEAEETRWDQQRTKLQAALDRARE